MQKIFIAIATIVTVIMVFRSGALNQPKQQEQELEITVQQESYTAKKTVQPIYNTPSYLEEPEPQKQEEIILTTYISSGPKKGEIIKDTNEVTFTFDTKTELDPSKGKIFFETKVEGFDSDWRPTSSKKRTIRLPSSSKEYTFLARSRTRTLFDPTPSKRTFKLEVSPYFDKVRISAKKAGHGSSPSLIQLTNLNEEKINITGWQIKSNKGMAFIGQGLEFYPIDFNTSAVEDIYIKKHDIVYLWGTSSPIKTNKSFRPNKCFGYLRDIYNFIPDVPISKKCSPLNIKNVAYLGEYCQDFVLKMNNCLTPDYSNNLRINTDNQCTSFIFSYTENNLNYPACVRNRSKDNDFLSNYWYVYLGSNLVSQLHDTIHIYDQDNLLIDKYTY